jgi:hypothetical protein
MDEGEDGRRLDIVSPKNPPARAGADPHNMVNIFGSSANFVGITSSRGTPVTASLGGIKPLPPVRGKEPERALESCASVANRRAKTCLVEDKGNSLLVNILRCVREPEQPTISLEEPYLLPFRPHVVALSDRGPLDRG